MNPAMMHGGGWFAGQPATGVSPGFVSVVSWWVVAGAALTSIGTGGERSLEHLQRNLRNPQHSEFIAGVEQARTPSQNLARIREILKPAVSDLATTFGVSRQSVYNWLNGEPVADENAIKLQDLAQAADILAHAGITVNAAVLKRKFVNRKTLLQVAQVGESARDAASLMVQIYKREAGQRERMNARYVLRATIHATADFDLPMPNDKV